MKRDANNSILDRLSLSGVDEKEIQETSRDRHLDYYSSPHYLLPSTTQLDSRKNVSWGGTWYFVNWTNELC